jgi:hypothetical protein
MEITPLNHHPSDIAAHCAAPRGGDKPSERRRWEPLLIGVRA